MAEVPEVETLVRDLREAAVGRTLVATEVLLPAAVRFPAVSEFTALLTGRVILESHRRAKYILLPLSGDVVLAIHLMLWGTVALVPTTQPRVPETLIREAEVLKRPQCGSITRASIGKGAYGIDGRPAAHLH